VAYHRTKYETVLMAPDGRRFLLLYTGRRSLPGLLACVRQRGAELCDRIGLDDSARCNRGGRGRFPVLDFGNGWQAGFSGRTQLEARQAGEYPWIFGGE
jgi:hypothetical protein